MDVPTDAFTVETLLTIGGSATAVWILTAVLASIVSGIPRWGLRVVSLVAALAFSYLALSRVEDPEEFAWLVAFVNGLVIYLTAVGENAVAAELAKSDVRLAGSPGQPAGEQPATEGFFTRWW